MPLFGFGIRVMPASESELRSIPSASVIWKRLWQIDVIYFLNVWQNPSGLAAFCFGRLLTIDSISYIHIYIPIQMICSSCVFFTYVFKICWHSVVFSIPLLSFFLSRGSVVMRSLFLFLILINYIFSLFSSLASVEVCQFDFLFSSKNEVLILLIFFSIGFLLLSALIFIIFPLYLVQA